MSAKPRPRPAGSSALLQAKIDLAFNPLKAVTDSVWEHEALDQLMPEFLASIYDSVRVTIPLMDAARRTAAGLAATDPVARLLPRYLETHIAEEHDHDQWLLKDLAAIGFSGKKMQQRLARPSLVAMAGAQYYWIFHEHPVAILGYLAVLEGHPPTISHLDSVRTRSGLPAAAFRMLRHHADADAQHAADLYAFLDTLPLSDRHQELIGMSALHTIAAIFDFFQDLATFVARPVKGRA